MLCKPNDCINCLACVYKIPSYGRCKHSVINVLERRFLNVMCDNNDNIEQQIEILRGRLKLSVKDKGYTHQETIRVSQQLDQLLNEVQKVIGR